MTVSPAFGDPYGKQVFYCSKNCTISLNISTVIWTAFAAVRLYSLIFFFQVKIVTRMARTLARMNRMSSHVCWELSGLLGSP